MSETGDYLFENIFYFTAMLRRAGIPLSPEQSMDFLQALTLIDISNREQVYHAARCLLLNRAENLRLFDAIFYWFWRLATAESRPHPQKAPLVSPFQPHERGRLTLATLMATRARPTDPAVDIADRSASYSRAEVLQHKPFSEMTPDELATIKRLMQAMRWRVSLRRTRRYGPGSSGQRLHLRRVIRSAAQHGGVPLKLTWQRRKIKQRPLVLLADISGSMEKYARLLLQFFYSVSHSLPVVECFVFGTRLTRITGQLRLKNIDRALDEAAHAVVDWAGGTRIGESLSVFNRRWARRVLRRGAIVLIISDGWERGDIDRLRQEMRFLQHRCYRLIWLNPLLGRADYQPLVEGMAAALPFIDDFLPIHNLQSLTALADHLGSLSGRRSARK